MQKLILAAIAAAGITGCASAPESVTNTYSYDSKAHTGTVIVNEKHYLSDEVSCPQGWRKGEVFTPKGLPESLASRLEISINADFGGEHEQFWFPVPDALGTKVLAKDYQGQREYMLGVDENGLVTQGEHFYHPQGYYVRVSNVHVDEWTFKACVGIDRMYVLDSDLSSSANPPIHLDRVVVPYAQSAEEGFTARFGSAIDHEALIRIIPK